jgi:polar amino acid transport system substrate-binding protein
MLSHLKRWVGLAACLAVLLAAAAPLARAQSVDDIIKRGRLLVGMDVANPPFGSLGTDGQPDGYDADFAKLAGKYLGVPVEFVAITPQNRMGYLLTNRVDMILLGVTPERARQIWFSIPYAEEAAVLVGPASVNVKTMADLAGKRIGIPRGALQDTVLSQSAPPGAQIMRFDDQATAVQAMIAGQVDLAGTGLLQYQLINLQDPDKHYETKLVLRPLNFAAGIRKGNTDFLQWLNTFTYAIKSDGELDAISQKWRHLPLGSLPVF